MRPMVANQNQHAIYTACPNCPYSEDKAKKTLPTLPNPPIKKTNSVILLVKYVSVVFGFKVLVQFKLIRNQLKS